jgi:hypothetical protein
MAEIDGLGQAIARIEFASHGSLSLSEVSAA